MHRRTLLSAIAAASLLTVTTGCQADSSAAAKDGTTTVTLALDWTPNTNHTGIYVAQAKGWFKDAGIDLKIVPYGSTAPETLLANHKADFGISYQEGVTTARAAGADITSVYAVTQKTNVTIAVRAGRTDIDSPKDLDGKTYAGFGAPYEKPLLQKVIQNAGGKGDFKQVTLNTSAYAALYAGKADFAMPMPTWEGVEAELSGKPLKNFQLSDYGFPAIYSTLVASSDQFLKKNPAVAKKFVAALDKGYRYAADHPDKAADLLISQNKSVLTNTALVKKSEALLAKEYYKAANGTIGTQSAERWQAFTDFEYQAGLLVDADGKKLTKAPDTSTFFTNDYLPAAK
ncbi:ABC-type nitrate/sulfonate/bicarbonate transport system substrate-binding protein [Streptomyces sp. TLI_55]|uniref:ABC transporter substrate-binding protein n=1 Tax=Streptomyces sp. TLI_55 TaxID=1938861 RepID=UPI000BD0A4AA|nr:ABC transporter substrate-binding protein [Streptomyces sp. TLI_55]SNX66136.1 ABC-type nitrate/sulfonate/bicarbonate transport system substrate-binding protein [Streptomyces sp. TLI_55]